MGQLEDFQNQVEKLTEYIETQKLINYRNARNIFDVAFEQSGQDVEYMRNSRYSDTVKLLIELRMDFIKNSELQAIFYPSGRDCYYALVNCYSSSERYSADNTMKGIEAVANLAKDFQNLIENELDINTDHFEGTWNSLLLRSQKAIELYYEEVNYKYDYKFDINKCVRLPY